MINPTDLAALLTKQNNRPNVVRIAMDYFILRRKFEHPGEQSWYFQRGIASNKKRMVTLREEYENIRDLYNHSSPDRLIEMLNEKNRKMERFLINSPPSYLRFIGRCGMTGQIAFLNELISLKSSTPTLLTLDEYYDKPKEFLKLTENIPS